MIGSFSQGDLRLTYTRRPHIIEPSFCRKERPNRWSQRCSRDGGVLLVKIFIHNGDGALHVRKRIIVEVGIYLVAGVVIVLIKQGKPLLDGVGMVAEGIFDL